MRSGPTVASSGGSTSLRLIQANGPAQAPQLHLASLLSSSLPSRTITYDYDGLSRLTGAVEAGATSNSYGYGYDLAGNRTSATVNGVTTSREYNAANQVVGWSYDAAGNLLSDGSASYVYGLRGCYALSTSIYRIHVTLSEAKGPGEKMADSRDPSLRLRLRSG